MLESLEIAAPADLDLVLVVTASNGTADLARRWASSVPQAVQIVGDDEHRSATLAETVLAYSDADWCLLPTARDAVSSTFFTALAQFLPTAAARGAQVVATRLLVRNAKGKTVLSVQRFKFAADTVLDLSKTSYVVQSHAPSTVLSAAALRGLPADVIAQSASAPQRLIAEVLLRQPRPLLGVAARAPFLADTASDSAVNSVAVSSFPHHVSEIERAYRPLFAELHDGGVPEWLGMMLLYELSVLLKREPRLKTRLAGVTPEVRAEFIRFIRDALKRLPEEWILGIRFPNLSIEARNLMLALRDPEGEARTFPSGQVRVARFDQKQSSLLVRYFFSGSLPREEFRVGGRAVEPIAAKTKSVALLQQDIYFERLVWLPAASWLQVELNGQRQDLVKGAFEKPDYQLSRSDIMGYFSAESDVSPVPGREAPRIRRRRGQRKSGPSEQERLWAYAFADRQVRRFSQAWIFMDRVNMAQDNAEHMYRFVVGHDKNVNAWFVLDRSSADWGRLSREGFNLVAFGSREHHALFLHAAHVISSHLSPEVISPIPIGFYPGKQRPWKTTFLQHGVTKDDMSHWLNQRSIDALITATPAEYESFVGDRTPYVVTSKEVALTGFPRHDALLEKRQNAIEAGAVDIVLVAPTWRDDLLKPKAELGLLRELVDDFSSTPYAREWSAVLSDSELIAAARRVGCRVVFLPHPNMQDAVDQFALPKGVEVVRYEDGDIQKLLARTRVLITDYSSLAFEAGVVSSPVVYLQSDRAHVFSGKHTYSPGYYDYVEHGFGPVVESVDAVAAAVAELLDGGAASDVYAPEPYATRIAETFVRRDGLCCQGVYDTVKRLDEPLRFHYEQETS